MNARRTIPLTATDPLVRSNDALRAGFRSGARAGAPVGEQSPRFDRALAVTVLLADLWLVSGVIVLGADGIFTEEWMGYPGMMDPGGQGYQAAAVALLRATAWWSALAAVLGRCWTTTAVQLSVLPLSALWIASFDTYYT
ncbi:hypothetical protein [Streptomyces sp. NPDC087297]|uniref:hypothetical protein n=1 Tax=Streptomyces sp. NPDC087297 TaxID=3365778 RepID=UPI0038155705